MNGFPPPPEHGSGKRWLGFQFKFSAREVSTLSRQSFWEQLLILSSKAYISFIFKLLPLQSSQTNSCNLTDTMFPHHAKAKNSYRDESATLLYCLDLPLSRCLKCPSSPPSPSKPKSVKLFEFRSPRLVRRGASRRHIIHAQTREGRKGFLASFETDFMQSCEFRHS